MKDNYKLESKGEKMILRIKNRAKGCLTACSGGGVYFKLKDMINYFSNAFGTQIWTFLTVNLCQSMLAYRRGVENF